MRSNSTLQILASGTLSFIALLAGCSGIPTAPAATPRTELEVDVSLDPSITALLRNPADREALQRIVTNAVLSLADVGLRFYPVSSVSYGDKYARPEYLLTVEIDSLQARLDQRVVRSQHDLTGIETAVEDLDCTVLVTLVRRRDDGPSLIVGRAFGRGNSDVREASSELSSVPEFELAAGPGGKAPTFSAHELGQALNGAVARALSQLLESIDRELEAKHSPERPVVR